MNVQENTNELRKELTNIALGLNRAFFQKKPKFKNIHTVGINIDTSDKGMPTLDFDWPKLTEEYKRSESNQRPVEATHIELGYQIEKLENDLAFEKESLRKVKHEYQTYMDDYKRLDTDYLNSQGEVKRLQAQVDKIPGLKRTLQWLMIEHLEMGIKLSSVEEKKEVDRTWL